MYLNKERSLSKIEELRWRVVNFYNKRIAEVSRFHQMVKMLTVDGHDSTPVEKMVVGRVGDRCIAYVSHLNSYDPRHIHDLAYIKKYHPKSLGRGVTEYYEADFVKIYPGVDMQALITPENQRLIDEYRASEKYIATCLHRKKQVNLVFFFVVLQLILKADCAYGSIDATINERNYIFKFSDRGLEGIKLPEEALAITIKDNAVIVDNSRWWRR